MIIAKTQTSSVQEIGHSRASSPFKNEVSDSHEHPRTEAETPIRKSALMQIQTDTKAQGEARSKQGGLRFETQSKHEPSSKTVVKEPILVHSTDTEHEGLVISSRSKTKRSSSASNDAFFERDRFRARFRTFNHTADEKSEDVVSCSEQPNSVDSSPGKLSVASEFEDISSKTKKLDIETSMASDTPSDNHSDKHVTFDLARSEPSERDSDRRHFPKKPVPQSTQHNEIELAYPRKENVPPLARESRIFGQFPLIENAGLDLRFISAPKLSNVFDWYFNKPLPPTTHMFPWLHGIHAENFAQRTFFARTSDEDSTAKPAGARFLMCIETPSSKPKMACLVRNTVDIEELLQKVEYSRMEVVEQTKALVQHIESSKLVLEYLDLQKDSDLVELLVADSLSTGFMPQFLNSDPERGISLRNFHIQVNKVARCADFVVYCADVGHETCKCQSFGRLLRVAQLIEQRDCAGNGNQESPFNVFVLNWRKSHFEEHPEIFTVRDCSAIFANHDGVKKTQLLLYSMILLKSDTFSAWDADFQVKEKVENIKMSAATRLHLNVWSGNVWDHQIMVHLLKGASDLYGDFSAEIRPCGQKHIYCDPEHSSVAKNYSWGPKLVSSLPPPRAHWQLFFHCHNDAAFPDQNLLSDLLFKYTITSRKAKDVTDVHHLEFPSSGSIGLGDCRKENLMSIVNSCKLLYLYSSSVSENSVASLIYCSDGYTESSLLVLCYIMYAENIPLEVAMLKLHLDYGSPYYIFGTDVQVLRKLEILLRRYSPLRPGGTEWSKLETISNQEISEILLYTPGAANLAAIPRKLRLGYISESDSSSDSETDEDDGAREALADRKWVEDVDGSLPSRILPYLYLGSLKHANNAVLLSKLGITKVISVGEQLDWLSGYRFLETHQVTRKSLFGGDIELAEITPRNHGSRLSVQSVMKVNNLQDDGIDELSRSLPRILDYIDEEFHKKQNDARILVHCRVGVSRSATVVIAEVMRRLNLNLPKAYLYVRVRRLNIVIQPNLRFMYELFKWEERVRERGRDDLRVVDWFVMCQEIKKLNLPFIRH